MNSASAASRNLSVAQPALGRRALQVVLGSLFVAVCAHLSVPLWFTPVPVTLQNFAVLVLGLLLGPGTAASAMGLYLLEGMAGLPVLSPVGIGGFLHLFGPSGGYLMAYPAAAALIGVLRRRFSTFPGLILAAAAGNALILISGAAWFEILTQRSAGTVLMLTVLPFLAGDTLKVIAAAALAAGMKRLRRA